MVEDKEIFIWNLLGKLNWIFLFSIFLGLPASDVPFINAAAERDLQVKSELQFDDVDDGEFCKIRIRLMAGINLENVQLYLAPNPAFVIPQDTFFLKDIKSYEKHSIEVTIYQSESQVAEMFSECLEVLISFVNKQSIVRVLRHSIEIPLKKVMKETTPQKEATFKVTLQTLKAINFVDSFPGEKIKLISIIDRRWQIHFLHCNRSRYFW